MLRTPHKDDRVRLSIDIPELYLQRGDLGVVRSTWFSPITAYEVAFLPPAGTGEMRVLVLTEQVQVEQG